MRIEGTLIPAGLHTFGRTWSTEAMAFMVASMISTGDTSIYRLLAADYGWIYDELTLDQRATLENRTLEMVMALLGGAKPEDITMAPDILQKLREASQYIELIGNSTAMEMTSLLNALDGGYVAAGLGRDPHEPISTPHEELLHHRPSVVLPGSLTSSPHRRQNCRIHRTPREGCSCHMGC